MFKDRRHAGRMLAEVLAHHEGAPATVVLGLPRGGVVVGAEIARRLRLPLDVIVTRKIGAPGNPEYAVAAVDADGGVLVGHAGLMSPHELRRAGEAERHEVLRRLLAYRGEPVSPDVRGRTVILVDDGAATGLTLLAAIQYLRRAGARSIIVAVPVASPDAAERLRAEADQAVILAAPHDFYAVGQYYEDFAQTSDAEVLIALDLARADSCNDTSDRARS